jgi:hypothetical protein
MEGKKMGSYKKDFEVAIFFSPQNIDFPFLFEETLGASLFLSFSLSSFFQYFFSRFSMLRLFEDSDFDDIRGEKTLFKNFFSDQMEWND